LEIELPDGTILDAPDGADIKAVVAGYNRQRTRGAAKTAWEDMAAPSVRTPVRNLGMRDVPMMSADQLRVGMAKPFVELGLGVKDLASKAGIGSGLSDEDRANLERLEEVKGGSAMTGRIAGEAATLALPGGAGQKIVTKGMSALPRALKYARPAMDMLTSAGVEALKAPTSETSRGERAAWGAAGAGLGHAVTSVARPVLTGIRATAQGAQELIDQGIPLTIGMMKGGLTQAAEQTLGRVPVIGGLIRARQREALEGWNRHMLNEVMPKGTVAAAGHEGMKDATKAFSESYEKLWSQDVPFNLPKLQEGWKSVVNHAKRTLPDQASKEVTDNLARAFQHVVKTTRAGNAVPGQAVSQLDDLLRTASFKARKKGDSDAATIYAMARSRMRAQLPPEMNSELSRLDNLYAQFAVLRKASSSTAAQRAGGMATPAQVQNASRALDRTLSKGATARGQAVLQPQALQAANVLGAQPRSPDTLGSLVLSPAALASTLTHNRPMSRLITGQTAPQRTMRELSLDPRIRAVIDALRHRTGPGQIGAAVEDDN
jgi:hypothetical protein